ncbi:uncharacterized protein A4U43_C03F3170 [Asparagus officinalis]|uniref:Uncharacterized protein n=1 Tax=Asparagus officinalis TaxID=4686 RepID=A0A5P1FBE1_ASPOF|nr:uncharacterized protein A4U43_C03F3170 [Asparagus officinalis]
MLSLRSHQHLLLRDSLHYFSSISPWRSAMRFEAASATPSPYSTASRLLLRQLFEKESSTYTYLLIDLSHPQKPAVRAFGGGVDRQGDKSKLTIPSRTTAGKAISTLCCKAEPLQTLPQISSLISKEKLKRNSEENHEEEDADGIEETAFALFRGVSLLIFFSVG